MESETSFPQGWTPPRELAGPLPRKTALTGFGRLQAGVGIVPIVAAIGLFLLMEHQISDDNWRNLALHTQGVTTPGRVLQMWGGGRNSTPRFSYSFGANGVRQEGYCDVPPGLRDRMRVGQTIPIRYLPNDPTVNHPAGWDDSRTPGWMPFFLPPGLVLFGAVFLNSLRAQHALLAKGVPARAVVTGCFTVKGGWSAHYEFRTDEGVVVAGKGNSSVKLENGTALCVLYDARKPARVRTYPLDAYRMA